MRYCIACGLEEDTAKRFGDKRCDQRPGHPDRKPFHKWGVRNKASLNTVKIGDETLMNEQELLDQIRQKSAILTKLKKEYNDLTLQAGEVHKQMNDAQTELRNAWMRLEKEIDANVSEDVGNEPL